MSANFKILLDVPTPKPALNFERYAAALRAIIETSAPRFAIGIFGSWGSGKTTLMEAIESGLDTRQMVSVRFSAWRYEKEEHLIIPLLDTIREALVQWGNTHTGVRQQALTAAATIGKVIYSLLAGLQLKVGLPGTLEVSMDANKVLAQAEQFSTERRRLSWPWGRGAHSLGGPPVNGDATLPRSFYHASFQALHATFSQFMQADPQRRIVVFIDDLDRCLPEGTLEMLESMKLFFDLEGFVFVVGLDRQVVESSIDVRYAKERVGLTQEDKATFHVRGADYIKKIFQVPFSLFPVAVGELDDFLAAICDHARVPAEQRADLQQRVRPHLDFLVTEAGINPREIKCYLNAYTLARQLRPELDPAVFLTLQTIEFRADWVLVRQNLYAYRDVFVSSLEQQVQGSAAPPGGLDPLLAGIPASFLDYVAPGKPGHPLVQEKAVDTYIYAGEATRPTSGPRISDLVRDVVGLREPIRLAVRSPDPNAPAQGELRQRISALRGKLLDSSSAASAFLHSVLRNLQEIEDSLNDLAAVERGERDAWVKRNHLGIAQMVSDLMQWSRQWSS